MMLEHIFYKRILSPIAEQRIVGTKHLLNCGQDLVPRFITNTKVAVVPPPFFASLLDPIKVILLLGPCISGWEAAQPLPLCPKLFLPFDELLRSLKNELPFNLGEFDLDAVVRWLAHWVYE